MSIAKKENPLNEDISILEELGLSEAEAHIYKSMLQLGPRAAGTIAHKAGLKRGQTYNVLERLTQLGLVQQFDNNNVKHFVASSPLSLMSLLELRENSLLESKKRLVKAIPFLENLKPRLTQATRVRFFHGPVGIIQLLEEMLSENEDFVGFLDFKFALNPCVQESAVALLYDKFVQKRVSKGLWFYAIANESTESTIANDPSSLRKLKLLKGKMFPAEINIAGNKVAMISLHGEEVGALIENENIATLLRNLFWSFWEVLPEPNSTD